MFGDRKKLVMCQACRGLIEASTRTCPLCGRDSVPPARVSDLAASGNFFSLVILTINIVLFVLMAVVQVRNGRGADAFFQAPATGVLYDFGALVPSLVGAGQWWRLVTFNFLHIGLMHLMFNSSALYSIGPQVEEIFGSQKFAFIYVGTGVASAFASYLFLPVGSAGASGAIFGLIGLMAIYGHRLGGSIGKALMKQMLIWAAIGLAFGFFIGANNVAHLGGLAAGASLGFLLSPNTPATARSARLWNATALGCIGLVVVSFALAGVNYGSVQDSEAEARKNRLAAQAKRDRAEDVITLAEKVRNAEAAIFDDQNLAPAPGRSSRAIAQALGAAAADLNSVPKIDDRSSQIIERLVKLINRRAAAFETATSHSQTEMASTAEMEALRGAFSDYLEWEDSVLSDYGLTRGNK